RFLYLVFTAFLLVFLAVPGSGQVRKDCHKVGCCSCKCTKLDVSSFSSDCKYYCCVSPSWKGK
ncbi:Cygnin, partial [Cariama cristata]